MRSPFADKISKLSKQNILISLINILNNLFINLSVASEVMGGMPKKKILISYSPPLQDERLNYMFSRSYDLGKSTLNCFKVMCAFLFST